MTRTRRRPAVLALFLLAAPAAAQGTDPGSSHVPIPLPAEGNPAAEFNKRIEQLKLRASLEGLLKFQGLLGQMQNGQLSPEQREQLSKHLAQYPELENLIRGLQANDPEALKKWQGLAGAMFQDGSGNLDPRLAQRFLERALPKLSLPQPANPARPTEAGPRPRLEDKQTTSPRESPAARPAPAANPEEQASRQAWARSIAEWADRFPQDKLAGPLRDSQAVRDLFRGLTQAGVDAMRNGGAAEGLDAQLARWESRWKSFRDWLPKELPERLVAHLPDLSGLPQPNLQMPSIDWSPPPAPTAPAFAAPSVDPGGALPAVLVVVAVVLAAAAFWRLRAVRAAPAGGRRRALGPWPLDPERVATREELIRAFEYLSLARCGESARSWHHRAIAERLGGTEAERRAAAEGLAELYERARYAPADTPEPDWTAARRPLTFLARMGSA
jgi:hypothetical protein